MIAGLILLVLLLLVFLSVSGAIIFHLIKYSPEKNQSIRLIAIYVSVSFVLVVIAITAFVRIDWDNLI